MKVKTRIKTSFGEIIIEAESPQEILKVLEAFPMNYIEKMSDLVSSKLTASSALQLKGIIELTTEGPVLITREKLTHYEAIGLILYGSKEKEKTSKQIMKLLELSGIKSMVPARLNEMTKRGQVYKPNPKKPQFKLTIQGKRWIEDEVLGKLRSKQD